MARFVIPCIALILVMSGCRSSVLDDPTTTIRFTLSEDSHVRLTVENSYNTVVATLIGGVLIT